MEKALRDYVRTSPQNRLDSFGGATIFDEPLVGFADGDDPIFLNYKKVVHADHFTPREILVKYLTEVKQLEALNPSQISVVSFILPIARQTRLSNTLEKEGPSLRWNHTRWQGQDFIDDLSAHLVSVLEEAGFHAVAPEISPLFKIYNLPDGFASNWSQRHMAYAAGLGTFSLNDGFITKKGMAMRCGSVVTDLKLKPSERPYKNHLANCRFHATGKCGVCMQRCPYGAITEKGHDKMKCVDALFVKQKPWIDGDCGSGYIGRYAGCGLCQTGVPCESRIPVRNSKR
ncbi:MAG: epoxyqueuosine reductase [Deltaproteobacteria bacterium]|nr:epoxyqueuosine reductase [Deltaproteobacteria bacterium]